MAETLGEHVCAEASEIVKALATHLPRVIDGREAIEELRAADFNWRQMEWIGFWFEYASRPILVDSLGGRAGPSFGRTHVDYERDFVWDLKAHPSTVSTAILNDQEAIEACIRNRGGIGFVIINGDVVYDESGEFKLWHDELKGGVSAYERERVSRGAPSRRRKSAFTPTSIDTFYFDEQADLDRAVMEGWMTFFQEGMRNSGGSARRPKYALSPDRAPDWARPLERAFLD